METSAQNKSLHKARAAKNDEFYTRLEDIETELKHYKAHFTGKTVLCNCDDPRASKFHHFFRAKFKPYGLKKLITTCYKNQNPDIFSLHKCARAVYLEYNGCKTGRPRHLTSDGDFRHDECIELLKQADIVVTNPPFSLFREYVAQLVSYKKKFLILGNFNALKYQNIFPLIKANKIWLGNKSMGVDMLFDVPASSIEELVTKKKEGSGYKIINGVVKARASAVWFTNLDFDERHEEMDLYCSYAGNEANYPKYDNYDVINVDKTADIPKDYPGAMGVPITFMDKYCPEQFEIIGYSRMHKDGSLDDLKNPKWQGSFGDSFLNGKQLYARIFIRNKRI